MVDAWMVVVVVVVVVEKRFKIQGSKGSKGWSIPSTKTFKGWPNTLLGEC